MWWTWLGTICSYNIPQQSGEGSLSQYVKFIWGGAFLKSLDEVESQFEDLLGFFKIESLQASTSLILKESQKREAGKERENSSFFSTPRDFTAHLCIFLRFALFVAQDEELTHRLQSGWALWQVKQPAPYPRLMIYPHHSSLDTGWPLNGGE